MAALSGHVLAQPGAENVAHDDLVYLSEIDAGPLQCGLDDDAAEFRSG